MTELGIESDDFIAIEGEDGVAVVRVRPGRAGERQRGIVGIDGQTRKAMGARVDRLVRVGYPFNPLPVSGTTTSSSSSRTPRSRYVRSAAGATAHVDSV